jgi:hypothetical protein
MEDVVSELEHRYQGRQVSRIVGKPAEVITRNPAERIV